MTRYISPTETRPARLEPLSKLPIFLDLAGQRVVVAGGGEPSGWKAELLAAAGAKVSVYASDPEPELATLSEASAGSITLERREWRESDLDGARLAVAEEWDPERAVRFAAAARARGVLVNVIDQPSCCDFQFGTIVNRSPVVIGISTDGAAPILGQAIRRRIEAILPISIGAWARAVKEFRGRLKEIVPSRTGRRRFWEKFVDVTFISQSEEDDRLSEIDRLARETLGEEPGCPSPGAVVIVGAGPGDPQLLTLRAMRELQAADVIVYDRLVTPEVLELGRREARRIAVGKEGHGPACRQDAINELIVALAREGRRVVRLKGGDPTIFGRAGEEIEACRAAGIPVAMVPGVTTATAAAATLNVSLTHRETARRVQFITGHDLHGLLPPDLEIAALADPKATTCVYMARRTAAELARRLVDRHVPESTPAIASSNVSQQGERLLQTTLGALAQGCELPGEGPLVLLIGAALAHAAPAGSEHGVRERLVDAPPVLAA
jgi:uroporphyrin-III C-methyltransferase / precorrin-2 dehydrogenase / sirohydrochlorin ferrochelatase